MDLADQMCRYFGTDDLGAVSPAALGAGLERMRVDLGLEQDRARRFALWTMMFSLGEAPALDVTFKDLTDRDAARNLMELTERLTPEDN